MICLPVNAVFIYNLLLALVLLLLIVVLLFKLLDLCLLTCLFVDCDVVYVVFTGCCFYALFDCLPTLVFV